MQKVSSNLQRKNQSPHFTLLKYPQTLSFKFFVAEFFLLRRFEFTHQTVRNWEVRFLPQFTKKIKTKRKEKIGKVWLVDETYVKVAGQWCYLYRGINEDGNLVDVRLSKTKDMSGTKAFFAKAAELHDDDSSYRWTRLLSSCEP